MSKESVEFSLETKAQGTVEFTRFRTVRYLRALELSPEFGSDACTPSKVGDVLATACLLRLEGKDYDAKTIDSAALNLADDERRQFAAWFVDMLSKSSNAAAVVLPDPTAVDINAISATDPVQRLFEWWVPRLRYAHEEGRQVLDRLQSPITKALIAHENLVPSNASAMLASEKAFGAKVSALQANIDRFAGAAKHAARLAPLIRLSEEAQRGQERMNSLLAELGKNSGSDSSSTKAPAFAISRPTAQLEKQFTEMVRVMGELSSISQDQRKLLEQLIEKGVQGDEQLVDRLETLVSAIGDLAKIQDEQRRIVGQQLAHAQAEASSAKAQAEVAETNARTADRRAVYAIRLSFAALVVAVLTLIANAISSWASVAALRQAAGAVSSSSNASSALPGADRNRPTGH